MKKEELKKIRYDLNGMSQERAAKLVGVSTRTWQRWESGETKINRGLAELFCMKINLEK